MIEALRWNMAYNRPNVMTALRARASRGEDVPALRNVPMIPEEAYPAWHAFLDLNARRTSNGFGPNPIQTSEILAWFDLHEIDSAEERMDYYHLIGVLDREWLRLAHEQAERTGRAQYGNRRRGGIAGKT